MSVAIIAFRDEAAAKTAITTAWECSPSLLTPSSFVRLPFTIYHCPFTLLGGTTNCKSILEIQYLKVSCPPSSSKRQNPSPLTTTETLFDLIHHS